jgi:hypothetical protein
MRSNAQFSATASRSDEKAIATLQARFALAGFAVHRLNDRSYLVLFSRSHAHCPDFDSLCAFARVVGVQQEGPGSAHAERAASGEVA